jgi:hypothetical protein
VTAIGVGVVRAKTCVSVDAPAYDHASPAFKGRLDTANGVGVGVGLGDGEGDGVGVAAAVK